MRVHQPCIQIRIAIYLQYEDDALRTSRSDGGNITSKKEYAYTEGTLGTPISTKTYTYADSAWGDLLTSYNGKKVTSDAIGNMLSDGTWSYTWEHGRQLASMSGNGSTWNFAYDANGLRTSRSNGTKTYSYVYTGGKLTQMTVGSDILYFDYNGNTPLSVTWNGTLYYYIVNGQGDVAAIVDGNGECIEHYNYDAWGNLLIPCETPLGNLNPLRYRSYVFDQETGLYYLQSRYYNPEMGRFISPDAFASTGQGLLGNNMFAYCGNNPVNAVDPSGEFAFSLGAFLLVSAISGVSNMITTWLGGGSFNDQMLAGLIGAAGGAIGYAIVAFTGNGMLARLVSSLLIDAFTILATNGKITAEDCCRIVADLMMDFCFSVLAYYYVGNGLDELGKTTVDALTDAGADIGETMLFQQKNAPPNTTRPTNEPCKKVPSSMGGGRRDFSRVAFVC